MGSMLVHYSGPWFTLCERESLPRCWCFGRVLFQILYCNETLVFFGFGACIFIIFLHATSWPHSDSMGPIITHFRFTQYVLNMGHKIIQKVEKKKSLKFSILKIVFPIALWLKVTRAHVVVGQLSKNKYQTMAWIGSGSAIPIQHLEPSSTCHNYCK